MAMRTTDFVDGDIAQSNRIDADFLNAVLAAVRDAIGDGTAGPTTHAQVRTNIGATAIGDAVFIAATAAAARAALGSTAVGDAVFIAATAAAARTAMTAAASGANTDITSLSAPALGAATATTAVAGDNSTKVATTAYVDRGASGASLVLIETKTISNNATLDFVTGITSTYDVYALELSSVVPQTDTANLWLRASVDEGANWLSTNEYDYAYNSYTAGAGALAAAGASAQAQALIGLNLGTGTGESIGGTVKLFGLAGAKYKLGKMDMSQYNATPATADLEGTVNILTATAVNGLRVMASSGNLTSGSVSLYGIRKS